MTDAGEQRTEAVRRRAFELYVLRGGQPGSPLDDWLAAEREVQPGLRSASEQPEPGSAPLPGTPVAHPGRRQPDVTGVAPTFAKEPSLEP